jgi:hypothetical protein
VPTAATRPPRNPLRLLAVFAAVIGLLVGLAGNASASTASQLGRSSRSAALVVSETRVGVATDLAPVFVGLSRSVSAGQVGEKCPRFLTTAPASCVATKPAGALVEEGTYVVKTAQGEYVGQSGAISRRLQQHVASGKFTQAEVNAAERAMVTGGKLQREIAEQLLIDSKGGIDGLLNKVNPIGPKRVPVMPNQPYKR